MILSLLYNACTPYRLTICKLGKRVRSLVFGFDLLSMDHTVSLGLGQSAELRLAIPGLVQSVRSVGLTIGLGLKRVF